MNRQLRNTIQKCYKYAFMNQSILPIHSNCVMRNIRNRFALKIINNCQNKILVIRGDVIVLIDQIRVYLMCFQHSDSDSENNKILKTGPDLSIYNF